MVWTQVQYDWFANIRPETHWKAFDIEVSMGLSPVRADTKGRQRDLSHLQSAVFEFTAC